MAKAKNKPKKDDPKDQAFDCSGIPGGVLEELLNKAGLGNMAAKISEGINANPGKKTNGSTNLLIAAGAFAAGFAASKLMKSKSDLEGLDQKDKKVKVISFEILLNGGTQEWFLEVDSMRVRFDVDHALQSATDGRIFVYGNPLNQKKPLDLGGSGEFQISTILRRWLTQFWTVEQQTEMVEEKVVFGEPDDICSYPATAQAAAKLALTLEARNRGR